VSATLETAAPVAGRVGTVAVTACGLYVPGVEPAFLPGEEHRLLGRKGLLYKEQATRLALCAVHRALGLPPGAPRAEGPPDPATAVVASSNLGNVATVRKVVETLREGSGRDVSPLDAPNASSNVVASTVAIWFRFGGPNLMVCSGATAGLDAIALGSLLLRAGRASRVVVVGAEPDDEVAQSLLPGLRAGAAALVLEPAGAGIYLSDVRAVREGPVAGDCYGADGILETALAVSRVAAGEPSVEVVCGDSADGWRALEVRSAGA